MPNQPVNPYLPYGRQIITEEDIEAVVGVLRSDWLTTGPTIDRFEAAICEFTGSAHAVAVNSGTAALHAMMFAAGIGSGDEVIVPAITFAATSNSVLYLGGKPVFVDVDPETLLIDPEDVARKISKKTKAVIAVDYGGQPCHYQDLRTLTEKHNLVLMADACHSIGATYKGQPVGRFADMAALSFHPVKHITTGEGGMVLTNDPERNKLARRFRNHGITTDHRQRTEAGKFAYDMVDLGFNYRLTDLQAALGMSQLQKLPAWLKTRAQIAAQYDQHFAKLPRAKPLKVHADRTHAYHLYVLRLAKELRRDEIFAALKAKNLGVNVHYLPVYLHPFYERLGYQRGLCPKAEEAYESILSIPLFPGMTDGDIARVCKDVEDVVQ